jgi:di/tripeptidase
MNLDERLEALTHTVELLAQMRIDDERKYEERFKKFEERFHRILDAIEKLAQIAESHERRLDGLEGQRS